MRKSLFAKVHSDAGSDSHLQQIKNFVISYKGPQVKISFAGNSHILIFIWKS